MEWYQTHPRTSTKASLVNFTLSNLNLRTTVLPRSSDSVRHGGLAVLLRGGAFRGSASDSLETKVEAQEECARSVERHLLRPYHELGVRAEVFLMVYDSDYCAGRGAASLYDGTRLWQPYAAHLRAITVASAAAAEQLSALAAALHVFLSYCETHSDAYDAVVATRYDMRFKSSLPHVMGKHLARFDGVRFLWRELGNNWRAAWTASPDDVAKAQAQGREKDLADWRKATNLLLATRNRTFQPDKWREIQRVPDTFHAFAFLYTRCFEAAVHHEMTLGWPPRMSSIEGAATDMRRRGVGRAGTSSYLYQRLVYLRGITNASHNHPGVPSSELNFSLAPLFPWNHWLHRVLPNFATALQVDRDAPEWRQNRTYAPQLGFLWSDGAFSSNPCSGSGCTLNPFYDFLPRNQWVIDSAICQRPHDFAYDEHTGSICCPAPDYCCPNSVADCSTPGATLFDASRISDHRLVNGWRRHFYSRPATRGPSTVCNASGWNGGVAHPVCFWALDDDTAQRVRSVWAAAPPFKPLEDDDDTHTWSAGGGPVTAQPRRAPPSPPTPYCN